MRRFAAIALPRAVVLTALMLMAPTRSSAEQASATDDPAQRQHAEQLSQMPPVPASHGVHVDNSGRKEKGHASFYADKFSNRKMANGRRMNPDTNNAASKQLPLGSVAKVTNTANGKSATVQVEDRGPYVDGRVVDVAPKVAQELGMREKGVAPVVVAPITVPAADGSIKLGAGAAEASDKEVKDAVQTTAALRGLGPQPQSETEAGR
jgi:rare lipoprotein A